MDRSPFPKDMPLSLFLRDESDPDKTRQTSRRRPTLIFIGDFIQTGQASADQADLIVIADTIDRIFIFHLSFGQAHIPSANFPEGKPTMKATILLSAIALSVVLSAAVVLGNG
jgi:hypothetical protein